MVANIVEYFAESLLNVLGMDMVYFETSIPITNNIVTVMLCAGWAILIGNLAFQALKSMMAGIGFEAEDPRTLFGRSFVMGFLMLGSRQVCNIGLSLTQKVINLLMLPSAIQLPGLSDSMFSVPGDASWLLCLIVGVVLLFQIVKLFFEIGERYVVLAVLTILSPLAFGVGGSKNTMDIFKGWVRMFASMCLMMVLSIVFLKLLISAMGLMPSGPEVIPWLIMIVALARVARKIDNIISRIGLNPAFTGDPFRSRLPGMLSMMVFRNITGSITKAARANKPAGESPKNGAPMGSSATPLRTGGTGRFFGGVSPAPRTSGGSGTAATPEGHSAGVDTGARETHDFGRASGTHRSPVPMGSHTRDSSSATDSRTVTGASGGAASRASASAAKIPKSAPAGAGTTSKTVTSTTSKDTDHSATMAAKSDTPASPAVSYKPSAGGHGAKPPNPGTVASRPAKPPVISKPGDATAVAKADKALVSQNVPTPRKPSISGGGSAGHESTSTTTNISANEKHPPNSKVPKTTGDSFGAGSRPLPGPTGQSAEKGTVLSNSVGSETHASAAIINQAAVKTGTVKPTELRPATGKSENVAVQSAEKPGPANKTFSTETKTAVKHSATALSADTTANTPSIRAKKPDTRPNTATGNESAALMPLFSPVLHSTRPYSQTRSNTQRALMLPDEILRLPNDKSLVLLRGQKPLMLSKIIPDELPGFKKLTLVRITDYVPAWRKAEEEKVKLHKKKTDDKPITLEDFTPVPEPKPAGPDDTPLLIPKSKLEEISPLAILSHAKK